MSEKPASTKLGANQKGKAPVPTKSPNSPKQRNANAGKSGPGKAIKAVSPDNKTDLQVQGLSAATPTPNTPSDGSITTILQALDLHTSSQEEAKKEYDRLVNEQKEFEAKFPDKFKEKCDCTATQRQELKKKSTAMKGDEEDNPLFRSLCSARKIKKDGAMGLSLDALVDYWLLLDITRHYNELQNITKIEVKQELNKDSKQVAEGQKQQPNKETGVNIPVKVEKEEPKDKTGDTTDGKAPEDNQPETKKQKIDHHHHHQPDRKAEDRPKVIYKEVVVIPDGHMLVKVSDYHKLQIDLRNSNESVEELSSRLSAIASTKLKDGNPNIADLSDKNRPTKLGEQFGGLYDDEWSEAFEALTEDDKMNDDEAIAFLMNILQNTYIFCMDVSSKQLSHMTKMFGNAIATPFIPEVKKETEGSGEAAPKPSVTKKVPGGADPKADASKKAPPGSDPKISGTPKTAGVSDPEASSKPTDAKEDADAYDFDDETRQIGQKFAKGLRKEGAMNTLKALKKTYHERVLGNDLKIDLKTLPENVTKYADKCLDLLWLMCVQDPPMQIQWALEKERVDVNNFKFYQSKGKWVKLSVWPAVFLCAGGAIVSKGYVVGGPQPEQEEIPQITDQSDSSPPKEEAQIVVHTEEAKGKKGNGGPPKEEAQKGVPTEAKGKKGNGGPPKEEAQKGVPTEAKGKKGNGSGDNTEEKKQKGKPKN